MNTLNRQKEQKFRSGHINNMECTGELSNSKCPGRPQTTTKGDDRMKFHW